MKALGNTGKDADDRPAGHLRLEHSPPLGGFMLYGVNKRGNIQVAESGGIVAVFSFSLAMFVISGLASISNYHENIVLPLQAATTVFIAAAIIGFIDDWGLLTRRQKAFVIGFAALPLVFLRPAAAQIDLIFRNLDFENFAG
jgi:UDP-N-acetylmuramyl pentapeptide phosphotransferase/UDP-N-acetylglucosamine-1-phosphate transferase